MSRGEFLRRELEDYARQFDRAQSWDEIYDIAKSLVDNYLVEEEEDEE